MNKKAKLLLVLLSTATVAAAGAVGLAGCKQEEPTTPHDCVWSDWTVTTKPGKTSGGKATRTCSGNGNCDATAEEKEYPLPALNETDYTAGEDSATCMATGSISYSYDKDGVSVSFDVTTSVNPDAHKYGNPVKTDPTGHYQVCENNTGHKTAKAAHDENGTDGACSVCGYTEVEAAVKEEVTVSGATSAVPKLYAITVETAGEYELLANGNAVDTKTDSSITIAKITDGALTELETGAQRTVELAAGKYYVTAYADLKFKLSPASEHKHVFNTDAWEKDDEGHWHSAICVHTDEKGDYATHTMGEWSQPDEDGFTTRTCECGYEETSMNATALTDYAEVGATGNYSATITATNYGGGYYGINDKYFNLTTGDEGKKFTVKILTDNTRITDNNNNDINTKGDSFSVYVGENDSLNLTLTTNDLEVTEGYSVPVAIRITVDEAPAEGDILRPIVVTELGEQTATVEANKKVYFKIGDFGQAPQYAVKFGDGLSVEYMGVKITNEATAVANGDAVNKMSWGNVYICVTSATAGEINFTLEEYWAPGTMMNPIDVQFGADKTNNVALEFGSVSEQWFKIESATSGRYVIKTTSSLSMLELRDSLELDSWGDLPFPILSAESGAAMLVELTANTPFYLRASDGDSVAFSFTVTPFSDEDKGMSAGEPYELTESAQLDLKEGEWFYVFTATTDGMITFRIDDEKTVYIWRYNDAEFSWYNSVATDNKMSITVEAGNKYYIKTANDSGATGKLNFVYGVPGEHDYVVTVACGETKFENVTVKLYGADEEPVATGVTVADGTVTLSNVDSSENYRVVLEGLPQGYGYYAQDLSIDKNADATTTYTATVIAYKDYTVKFILPEGAAAIDLSGITVTATAKNNTTFTAETDDQGEAVISALPPYENGNFIITFELSETVGNSYKYVYLKDNTGMRQELFVSDLYDTAEVELTAHAPKVNYNLTLKDGNNNLLEGVSVTIDGVTGTTDENGQVTINAGAGVHEITISGNWVTTTKTTEEGGDIEVICNRLVTGALSLKGTLPELPLGSIDYEGSNYGYTYCQFTAAEQGTYVITYATDDENSNGIDGAYNKFYASILSFNDSEGDYGYGDIITDITAPYYVNSITITVEAGYSIILKVVGDSGTFTVTKA